MSKINLEIWYDSLTEFEVSAVEEYAKAKTEELQKEVEIRERKGLELHRQIKGWKQENQNHRKYTDKLKAENEVFEGLLNRILKSGAKVETIKSVIRTELRKTKEG